MFYGSQRLGKKQTTQIPSIKDVKPSIKESKTYELMIPAEKLVFEMSELKQEVHDSKGVFAIIIIKYPSLSTFQIIEKNFFYFLFF